MKLALTALNIRDDEAVTLLTAEHDHVQVLVDRMIREIEDDPGKDFQFAICPAQWAPAE